MNGVQVHIRSSPLEKATSRSVLIRREIGAGLWPTRPSRCGPSRAHTKLRALIAVDQAVHESSGMQMMAKNLNSTSKLQWPKIFRNVETADELPRSLCWFRRTERCGEVSEPAGADQVGVFRGLAELGMMR